jgi:hypothetical protein
MALDGPRRDTGDGRQRPYAATDRMLPRGLAVLAICIYAGAAAAAALGVAGLVVTAMSPSTLRTAAYLVAVAVMVLVAGLAAPALLNRFDGAVESRRR